MVGEKRCLDPARKSEAKLVEPLNVSDRRAPWSLLRTQWLDVPVGADAGHARPTWGGFSEVFEGCLRKVARHVDRRVDDRASLEAVVATVLVENLDVLVASLGERERHVRLCTAADLLIAQRASDEGHQSDGCERSDRTARISKRAAEV